MSLYRLTDLHIQSSFELKHKLIYRSAYVNHDQILTNSSVEQLQLFVVMLLFRTLHFISISGDCVKCACCFQDAMVAVREKRNSRLAVCSASIIDSRAHGRGGQFSPVVGYIGYYLGLSQTRRQCCVRIILLNCTQRQWSLTWAKEE